MFTHFLELKEAKPTYPPSAPMRLHPEAFKLPAQLTHTGDGLKTFLKDIYKQEDSEYKFNETFKKQIEILMERLRNAFSHYAKEYKLDDDDLYYLTNYPDHLATLPAASVSQIKLLLEEFVYLIQEKRTVNKTQIREELQKREKEKNEPFDEKQVEAQYALEIEEINAIELRKQNELIGGRMIFLLVIFICCQQVG